jgi:hypothetical protein
MNTDTSDDQGGNGTNRAYCKGHQDSNPKYIHLQAKYMVERTACSVPQAQASLKPPAQ